MSSPETATIKTGFKDRHFVWAGLRLVASRYEPIGKDPLGSQKSALGTFTIGIFGHAANDSGALFQDSLSVPAGSQALLAAIY